MNRGEYMARLEQLLSRLPEEERRGALDFYENYLEDAGIGVGDPVPEELESPEQAAATIRTNLQGERETGAFTDEGYVDTGFTPPTQMAPVQGPEQKAQPQGDPARGWKLALVIVLAVVLCPIWIGLGGGLLGVLAGVFGVLAAVAAAAGVMTVCGLFVAALGVVKLCTGALTLALGILGAGFLLMAFGWLFVWLSVLLWGRALPGCIRGIVRVCRRIAHGRKAEMG